MQEFTIPTWKCEEVNMDFVTGLPRTRHQHDSVWVIIDRMAKSAHFLPVRTSYSTEDYAKLYIRELVRLHGVLLSIISDRGTQFTFHFWKAFQKGLDTQVYLSTAFHPQTDGQPERTIKTLEDMLRVCAIDFKGNVRRKDLEFEVNDYVYLMISPMKGVKRFGKKGKLSHRINLVPINRFILSHAFMYQVIRASDMHEFSMFSMSVMRSSFSSLCSVQVALSYMSDILRTIWNLPLTRWGSSQPKFTARVGVSESTMPQGQRQRNSLSGNLPNALCYGLPILKGLYLSINKLHGHMPTSSSSCCQHQILSLSENEFDGPIHSEIGRLSNLQLLYLGFNHFTGMILQGIGNLVNLVELVMDKNYITGSVPISIFNISSLQILSLSTNNLSGFFPQEIGNLTKMHFLYLDENRFTGLRKIALTNTNLSGSLPPNIGSILPNIEGLYLRNLTNLVGTIPHSISNCSKLTILELSGNKLSGLIPNSLGYLTHLQVLSLGANNLTKDSSLTNCRNLTLLSLSRNPLNGMLPVLAGNLSASLKKFYTDRCKIKGHIPYEVGNFSNLIDFNLNENNLVGSIPTSIGNLRILQGFFLIGNNLTGTIGYNLCKLQRLGVIELINNLLSGSLPNCLGNITFIREIYLGSNKFSSNIPTNLGNLKDLLDLDLSSNNMVGSLPPEIGNLKVLVEIDLSMNGFSNEIPREIWGLQNLEYLSLRHNMLHGAIPDSMSNIVVKVFSLQLDAGFKSFDTECEVLRNLPHRNLVKVITSCSNPDFKVLVLEYMPNGSLEKYLYSHNSFLDIMQRLSIMIDVACALEYLHHGFSLPLIRCDLKHCNVLLDEDMVAHLSDFGISKLLGEDESDLYTKTLAALGYIAPEYGLDGLVSTKCDIYSYGIMLLETFARRKPNDFEGDVNLSNGGSNPRSGWKSAIGSLTKMQSLYLDENRFTEYRMDGLVSIKCDVYIYGIMLLETFTRRKPNEFEGDLSLKQWVSYSLPEAVMDVVDVNLLTSTGNRLQKDLDVVASIMEVAFDCCAESRARRTNLKDVVGILQKTKIQLLGCGACSSK
ncbi:hypothetical protein T459_11479 [Capsicum annuum]|uniref:non-specific serine/threonine protein kinase n=1 Tax=Capsicum annuum TaxID=4072 RepID=A0A2G2ZM13_CAPAN|nr:hypothetical protein T459_11479 [Capsicum annuum]